MDVLFQGFQSALPFWLIFILFIAAALLSWWSYKDVGIPSFYRYLLITLRSAVFFILLILLAAPVFRYASTLFEKPEILVFLDNSASTALKKGSYQGAETYQNILNDLAFEEQNDIQFQFYTVDDSLQNKGMDSLGMDASQTNLSAIVDPVRKRDEAQAAILISDGIYTQGRNPIYQITSSDIPIQAIALGDTTTQKDILIKNVATNRTGYLNTTQPVDVTVVQNGLGGRRFSVQLKNGDAILESKTVSMSGNSGSQTITFELNHQKTGLQQYQIAIPALQSEWTAQNNRQSFSIDVLDNKQRILSLAFEIHPDVRLMRTLLNSDKNTALTSRTWLGGNRFIEDAFKFDADSLNIIIMHGYPRAGLPAEIKRELATYLQEVPLFIMASPQFSYAQFQQDIDVTVPVSGSGNPSIERVTPVSSAEPTAHPIMDLPESSLNHGPALNAPIEGLSLAPGSEMLFESQFQGNDTSSPLLAVQQTGNIRRAQITAFNWYKMRQSSDDNTRAFAEQLLLNTVSWTAQKPDTRNLTIQPSQQTFENDEAIILNGFLIDERGEKESEAQIEVRISGENIDPVNYSMQPAGNGQYRLHIDPLPQGIYTFSARAEKGERAIGTFEGQFSVTASNAEFIDTRRNDELLQGLAQKTGGKFYEADQVESLWKDMENNQLLNKEEKVSETLFYPNQHLFWFIMVILLLATEWSIRKYLALP